VSRSMFPIDPWPEASRAAPSPSPAASATPSPASSGNPLNLILVAGIALLLCNLGYMAWKDVRPVAPKPGPNAADPVADLRPKLISDGQAYAGELARSFGEELKAGSAKIDPKAGFKDAQATMAADWQVRRDALFDARFSPTLASIIPDDLKGDPSADQIARYKAALAAIGDGVIIGGTPPVHTVSGELKTLAVASAIILPIVVLIVYLARRSQGAAK
jgi:hypothetical protein